MAEIWCSRDETSRSEFLEKQGDTSESWQSNCLLHEINHIGLLMIRQSIEMGQWRNWINQIHKMSYFWVPNPFKIAIWGIQKVDFEGRSYPVRDRHEWRARTSRISRNLWCAVAYKCCIIKNQWNVPIFRRDNKELGLLSHYVLNSKQTVLYSYTSSVEHYTTF